MNAPRLRLLVDAFSGDFAPCGGRGGKKGEQRDRCEEAAGWVFCRSSLPGRPHQEGLTKKDHPSVESFGETHSLRISQVSQISSNPSQGPSQEPPLTNIVVEMLLQA